MSRQAILGVLLPEAPPVNVIREMKLAAATMSGGIRIGHMSEAEKDAEWFDELQAALPRSYADGWV